MSKISMKMGKTKTTKHRGSLNIDSMDIPEAKNWTIGQKVQLTVEVEVTGLRQPDMWEIEEHGMKKDIVKVQTDILKVSYSNATK